MESKKDNNIIESPIQKDINLDELYEKDPNGYAVKFNKEGRKLIIGYLNTRPMAQVEIFFVNMFDIKDQDPFYSMIWVKKIFDYLKQVCPRQESKPIIIKLSQNTMLFKTEKTEPNEEEKIGDETKK